MTNEPLLAELIDRCDTVVHLAAAVGVKLIVEAPVRTIETNVHGTEVVLKHANKKKKLVADRLDLRGLRQEHDVPFKEDADLVLGPTSKHRWAYACSKMIDEFLALAYWKERKLPVIVVRLFNTVGPRQTGQYGMVVPNFVRQALAGRADHGVRRRHAVAQLHLRRGRREGYGSLDRRASRRSARSSISATATRSPSAISRCASRTMTGKRVADREDPVRPGLRSGLRGHAAARSRTSRRSARSSATSRRSSSTRS